jgi:hypothetical protein
MVGRVPKSAKLNSPNIQNHSFSGSDLVLISLTRVLTNSRKDAKSLSSIHRTTDELVKYLTAYISIFRESSILRANLTASSPPTSSILGTEILPFGATLVFPANSRHCTVPPAICHLR